MGSLEKRRRWLAWWDGKFRSLAFDIMVALIAIQIEWDDDAPDPLELGVTILSAPAFLVRRRFPWLAVIASLGLAMTATGKSMSTLIAVYTMARWRGPGKQLWIATGLVYVVIGFWLPYLVSRNDPMWNAWEMGAVAVGSALIVGFPMLLGLWLFQRKKLVATLRDRAEQAERERDLLAERAVTTERRRIAREMHDVIAHRCSVISLQAGALTVSAPDERTGEVAEVIRKTSATALTELRSMLRVLRDEEDEAQHRGETADDPAVSKIEALVADADGSGANVRLDMPDQLPETSSEVGRAAYRVVQEALTNAAKHAPHAAVRVEVAPTEDELVVTVTNQRGRSTDTDAIPGSGYGLIGMRERVTLAGGTMRTGATEDGGYRVRAVFPLDAEVGV